MVSRSRRRREAKERAASGGKKVQPSKSRPKRAARSTLSSTTLQQSGVDVLGVASITKKTKVGDGLLRFNINPRNLAGTRLGEYATLWARWRPIKLRLEIIPAAGMMIPGAYCAAWSANSREDFPAGAAAVAHLSSLVTQIQKPIGMVSNLNIPCVTTSKWYTFTGEPVDVDHGSIVSVLAGTLGADGTISVTFKLHWTIEFNGPDIPTPVEDMLLEPGPGWENIFTDSVSDWADGKKLTFKMHSGGSVVEWPGVKSGVVYTSAAGTTIKYISTGTTEAEVKYFSRIIDSASYSTGLACHATEENAAAYQRTGDLTKVLSFVAAGPVAVPDKPRLVGKPVAVKFSVDLIGPSIPPALRTGPASEPDRIRGLEDQISELRSLLTDLALRLDSRTALQAESGSASSLASSFSQLGEE